MSYYCRTVKFTFISEFAKKSFISQLNSSVNAIYFERGLNLVIVLERRLINLSMSQALIMIAMKVLSGIGGS